MHKLFCPPRLATWVALAGLCALVGCSTPGPRIDTRFAAQAQDSRVQFIVLHYTVGGFASALNTLTQTPVSSHYLVDDETGAVLRLVDEGRRAFHAGVSQFEGVASLNAASIGIEIVNPGLVAGSSTRFTPFPPAQIQAVVALVRDVAQRHQVRPHRIVGHSDVAPGRKLDPGPLFPWRELVAAGLVPWPDEAQVARAQAGFRGQPLPSAAWFQARLAQLGMVVPASGQWDTPTRDALSAFQMKYRPALFTGRPDAATAAWLQVATSPGGLLLIGADGVARPYQP